MIIEETDWEISYIYNYIDVLREDVIFVAVIHYAIVKSGVLNA